ncbi:MAG: ABC transporter permease [Lachnospiraceae bacterium]|nr:ABC transporter permease [Lachnospiraceae bacterium]
MLDVIICEFCKWKRKRLFQIAYFTSFIMPLLYSMILSDCDLDDMMSVVREENGFLILIPFTVVIAAHLFFEEQDNDTLKNLMCVPVSKSRIVFAKLFVLLLFGVAYELAGFGITAVLAVAKGVSLEHWGLQLLLTIGTGILLWAAAMPCILLVIWFNKSYIISVIIAFTYTVLGYILHISDAFLMVPLGLNVATFLPVSMIFRWLYQFHSLEGAGNQMIDFYQRFSPYFVSTQTVVAILLAEALACMGLMMKIYQKQSV